ncbi:MAG: hypothetical protein J6R67_11620 [Treponema sp.]|nr:hypothetical protein [Treponema sp.]
MKVYDKAIWHIDGGESKDEVLKKFATIFTYLKKNEMLTDEGLEIFDLGIDSSVSLHERLVNDKGKVFLDKTYDSLLKLSCEQMENYL